MTFHINTHTTKPAGCSGNCSAEVTHYKTLVEAQEALEVLLQEINETVHNKEQTVLATPPTSQHTIQRPYNFGELGALNMAKLYCEAHSLGETEGAAKAAEGYIATKQLLTEPNFWGSIQGRAVTRFALAMETPMEIPELRRYEIACLLEETNSTWERFLYHASFQANIHTSRYVTVTPIEQLRVIAAQSADSTRHALLLKISGRELSYWMTPTERNLTVAKQKVFTPNIESKLTVGQLEVDHAKQRCLIAKILEGQLNKMYPGRWTVVAWATPSVELDGTQRLELARIFKNKGYSGTPDAVALFNDEWEKMLQAAWAQVVTPAADSTSQAN